LETEFHYPFDFSLYTQEEITQLIDAVHYFERAKDGPLDPPRLKKWIATYRSIISNRAEEKRLDAIFQNELGFTVYALNKKVRE